MHNKSALAAALKRAMVLKGVRNVDVAREFGVRPPSVTGWMETGRIGKKHIQHLIEYFSDVVGLEHWGISPTPASITYQSSDERHNWGIKELDTPLLAVLSYKKQERRSAVAFSIMRENTDATAFDKLQANETELVLHASDDAQAIIAKISGDALRPRYRHGEYLLIEPSSAGEPGDDVFIITTTGASLVRELTGRRGSSLFLRSVVDGSPLTLSTADIKLIGRASLLPPWQRVSE